MNWIRCAGAVVLVVGCGGGTSARDLCDRLGEVTVACEHEPWTSAEQTQCEEHWGAGCTRAEVWELQESCLDGIDLTTCTDKTLEEGCWTAEQIVALTRPIDQDLGNSCSAKSVECQTEVCSLGGGDPKIYWFFFTEEVVEQAVACVERPCGEVSSCLRLLAEDCGAQL
jgi:hypothetical protein